jgi:ribosome recycling factor
VRVERRCVHLIRMMGTAFRVSAHAALVSLRAQALDVLKQAKKKGRSEDECARDEKAVQKLHDEFMAEIEGCSEAKRKELMSLV